MRLDFNVLWVDDQENMVQSQRESIERKMRNDGFKLQPQFAGSVEAAKSFLSDSIYGDHIDLVLMDYNLAGDGNGGDGLELVREKFPFKDIVFYSAINPAQLKKMVMDKQIAGVFCTNRLDLPDTVYGVFSELVKKVLDIEHSRGIVMGATSEIDDYINHSLNNLLSRSDPDRQAKALEIAKTQVSDIRKDYDKDFDDLESLEDVREFMSYHRVYSSTKRLILLRKLLRLHGWARADVQPMIDYETKTVPSRNKLAHVTVERAGFSRRLLSRGTELTLEDMRLLRIDLLIHHEWFELLLSRLPTDGADLGDSDRR